MKLRLKERIYKIDGSIIAMLIWFAINCYLAFSIKTLHYVPDELGSLSGTAKIMGYDWSGIWNRVHAYYGVAPGFIYLPLFLTIKDSILLYRAMLIVTALVSSLSAFFAYKIIDEFVGQKQSRGIKVIAAIACCAVSGWRVSNVMNEFALTVCIWAIIYFFIKMIRTKKYIKYWIIELAVCLMSLLSHTRAIIAFAAFFLAVLLWDIGTRKNWKFPVIHILTGGFIFSIYNTLTPIFQQKFYYTEEGQALANSLSTATGQLTADYGISKFSLRGISGFLDIFTGNMFALSVVSAGIIIFACVIYSTRLKSLLMSVIKTCKDELQEIEYAWVIPFAAFAVSILGFAYINMSFAAIAKTTDVTMSLYLYPRYFSTYLGPMVAFALIYVLTSERIKKRYFAISLALFAGVALYAFYSYIHYQSGYGGDILDAWRVLYPLNGQYNWRVPMYFDNYLVVFELIILLMVILFISNKKVFVTIVLLFGIFQYSFTNYVFDRGYTDFVYDQVSATYYFIINEGIGDEIKEIYFDGDYNARSPYALQFLLRDMTIYMSPSKGKGVTDSVIFTSRISDKMVRKYSKIAKYVMMDEDEYLILVGDENIALFESTGIQIRDFV